MCFVPSWLRVRTVAGEGRALDFMDYRGFELGDLVSGEAEKNSASGSHLVKGRGDNPTAGFLLFETACAR